ncbi:MAG: FAD-dependent oxidoreductase [Ruminococcaceae bacterium]|nr:FAD-dependent oxidoreductase [Oscillospiraceae bacterium]
MLETINHRVDLCVVGGGMSGVCAAIAAARNGIKTLLMQERPMLGGNASSEVRMWICGAHGENNRETGIIEEIALENLYRNPDKNHFLFDYILLEKVKAEPNLTLLLNCSCMDAETNGNRITSVRGWQSTTQCFHHVEAELFADCSGDSILAPLTGADFRYGRESASEFGEKISVETPDRMTMGISCLIQARKTDRPSEFIPPDWMEPLTEEQLRARKPRMERTSENFWYLEYGGELDCIKDTETIRDRLLAIAMSVWNYVKNSGEFEDAPYWSLDFIGFLPAKRESRRMVGKYLMNSNDTMSGGLFPDTVAFGGWGLDDHDPRGFFHKGKPNVDLKTPSPYGIPYRCLYSANVENLLFAGRNISMTHAAMSSSRVMATCALLGEAVGTAAAIAVKNGLTPHGVYTDRLEELQQTLMKNDCFLPRFQRTVDKTAMEASLTAEGVPSEQLERLRNGIDRNHRLYGEGDTGCVIPAGTEIRYRMEKPTAVSEARITFDSDLDRLTLPGDKNERIHITRANVLPDSPTMHLPTTLVREYELWAEDSNGNRELLRRETENRKRTVRIPIQKEICGLILIPKRKWIDEAREIHIFSFDFSCS